MPRTTSATIAAEIEPVRAGQHFPAHNHERDQLAWLPGAGARIRVGSAHWQVHGGQFAWIPAYAEHEVDVVGPESILSLYLDTSLRPRQERWSRPLVLPVDEVAGAVVRQLCEHAASPARERAAVELLRTVLEETPESYDTLSVPREPRARAVAEAILAAPDAPHGLTEHAQRLGVSTKTLLRSFLAETGLTFAQWRTRARVYAAERHLADGVSTGEAAALVGFATPTGFIKAFRTVFGTTPAAHARAKRRAAARRGRDGADLHG